MKRKLSVFTLCSVLFLFIFAFFMCWYIPSMTSINSKIAETRQNLDSSRGRENKQQNEYERALEELPQVQAELQSLTPLAQQAEDNVNALKARRKELRAVKKEIEQQLTETESNQEEKSDE